MILAPPIHESRLLVAAYTDRDSWEMNAVAFDGNVYLEDHFTTKARQKRFIDFSLRLLSG
jgi:hypothetical protein